MSKPKVLQAARAPSPYDADPKLESFIDRKGYRVIYCPKHPKAYRGYYAEHRIVMERVLGRELGPHERVRHINGVAHDNRPENLELCLRRPYAADLYGVRVDSLIERFLGELQTRHAIADIEPDRALFREIFQL